MKKIFALLFLLLSSSIAYADISNQLNIEEEDGSPSTYPYKLKVTNGTLTDNGDGTASLTIGGSPPSPGGSNTQVQFNDSGSLSGDAGFTYNVSTKNVVISGNETVVGLTASELLSTNASKTLTSLDTATYPSLTEISYVKGVTSSLQSQIDGKQASGSYLTSVTSDSPLSGSGTSGSHLVLDTSGTWTGSANTLTTARTIGGTSFNGSANIDPKQILLDSSYSDSTGQGIIVSYTYGESITLGAPVYIKFSDGRVYNADSNGTSTYPAIGLALSTASSGSHQVLLRGIYQFASSHTDFVSGLIYISTDVGLLTQDQPSGTDNVIQVIGTAISGDTILVNPSADYITHT